jgi:hypothetical protein
MLSPVCQKCLWPLPLCMSFGFLDDSYSKKGFDRLKRHSGPTFYHILRRSQKDRLNIVFIKDTKNRFRGEFDQWPAGKEMNPLFFNMSYYNCPLVTFHEDDMLPFIIRFVHII